MSKACSICGVVFPLSNEYFYKRKDTKDGFYNQCKRCIIKKSKEHDKNNIEKKRENDRKYWKQKYSRNPKFYSRLKPLHVWMRRNKEKQEYCTICNEIKFLEIASINHSYTKNPKDWIWLCRECHNLFDKISKLRRTEDLR